MSRSARALILLAMLVLMQGCSHAEIVSDRRSADSGFQRKSDGSYAASLKDVAVATEDDVSVLLRRSFIRESTRIQVKFPKEGDDAFLKGFEAFDFKDEVQLPNGKQHEVQLIGTVSAHCSAIRVEVVSGASKGVVDFGEGFTTSGNDLYAGSVKTVSVASLNFEIRVLELESSADMSGILSKGRSIRRIILGIQYQPSKV